MTGGWVLALGGPWGGGGSVSSTVRSFDGRLDGSTVNSTSKFNPGTAATAHTLERRTPAAGKFDKGACGCTNYLAHLRAAQAGGLYFRGEEGLLWASGAG